MKQLLFAASALAFAVGLSAPVFAAPSAAECTAMFEVADANDDGWVAGAAAYLDAMKKAGLIELDANRDRKLNADEFQAACMKDVFKDMTPAPAEKADEE
jgi:hypothetical protein